MRSIREQFCQERARVHREHVEHNERFVNQVEEKIPDSHDWSITAVFYAALQYIDAYLAQKGNVLSHKATEQNHRKRIQFIDKDHVLSRIKYDYLLLKSKSETARYKPPTKFIADDVQKLIDNQLQAIKDVILPHL
ncbi:hypothetical protein FJZ31_10610 [Candidatus Poribacteria bacterium]|nr:hypothetical protein [Candidatus Poribacteria bacterium]